MRPTPHPGDDPGRKVQNSLHTIKVTSRGPAPDREAVQYVGENVGLDEEFEGFRGEIWANFIQRKQDGVALFDKFGYVLLPG